MLALEFSSLTFQRWDRSATNVVSTAIFGDGGGRGGAGREPEHPRAPAPRSARLVDAESVFFPGTTHLMGFRLRNQGLQIVLDRALAAVRAPRGRCGVVDAFLSRRGLGRDRRDALDPPPRRPARSSRS